MGSFERKRTKNGSVTRLRLVVSEGMSCTCLNRDGPRLTATNRDQETRGRTRHIEVEVAK
jgi:hypothetical protein